MTAVLNPYLTFNGNAGEAMENYRSIFGGELTVLTFGTFGMPEPSVRDKVMHAMLTTPQGFTLMGSDCPPGVPFAPGFTITISLSGAPEDDMHEYWKRLADGGDIRLPLGRQMWGDECGQLTDRFGVAWYVNIRQPRPPGEGTGPMATGQ
ncbi:VOC family protein [Actinoplanes sp. NPDC051851]|uniref:VOC family protein n=1 Tax=Actinoplanes sp. NPDC051851 TaxID=3154753 RepID=UPI003421D3BC